MYLHTHMNHTTWRVLISCGKVLLHTARHCKTLQHTATHCNTLQHTAAHHNRSLCVALVDLAQVRGSYVSIVYDSLVCDSYVSKTKVCGSQVCVWCDACANVCVWCDSWLFGVVPCAHQSRARVACVSGKCLFVVWQMAVCVPVLARTNVAQVNIMPHSYVSCEYICVMWLMGACVRVVALANLAHAHTHTCTHTHTHTHTHTQIDKDTRMHTWTH